MILNTYRILIDESTSNFLNGIKSGLADAIASHLVEVFIASVNFHSSKNASIGDAKINSTTEYCVASLVGLITRILGNTDQENLKLIERYLSVFVWIVPKTGTVHVLLELPDYSGLSMNHTLVTPAQPSTIH